MTIGPESSGCIGGLSGNTCGPILSGGAMDWEVLCGADCMELVASESCQALANTPGMPANYVMYLNVTNQEFICKCLYPVDTTCGILDNFALAEEGDESSAAEEDGEMLSPGCCENVVTHFQANPVCSDIPGGLDAFTDNMLSLGMTYCTMLQMTEEEPEPEPEEVPPSPVQVASPSPPKFNQTEWAEEKERQHEETKQLKESQRAEREAAMSPPPPASKSIGSVARVGGVGALSLVVTTLASML
eukprot:CAMPEP_0197855682 /NCGR_PEP_ID=MMETSP1438-20131217/27077_1 /TAXON_ID=1461541 /ORGANISM="Pterosperma sp., Strain CCMP1384" /LENGTH=244 /DNA_ID=CAMNT_0043470881 /DNA_START=177 /DNA_END=911 /DNA_ORIENTATION=+